MLQIEDIGKYLLLCSVVFNLGSLSVVSSPSEPQLSAVSPDIGVTTPGSKVAIHGSGFSPDTIVYFGGLQVREMNFVSSSTLEVITPYLRPGNYQLQLKSGETIVRSQVTFRVIPSDVDSEMDRAITLADKGQATAGITILTSIANTNSDYQVRAFAHYQVGQIYFALGDWWHWAGDLVFLDADKSGMAVQTSWRYGLSNAWSTYLLNTDVEPDYDLRCADIVVEFDVTQNPEPRFYRGLVNARYGDLKKAKIDSDFILKLESDNPSYRALAAYIAVLGGDAMQLRTFSDAPIKDARALALLGEAAYLSGDSGGAQRWWKLAAKEYPLGASLAYWTGKKHLVRGQQRIAASLLTECTVMVPDSKEVKEAKDLLATLQVPSPR